MGVRGTCGSAGGEIGLMVGVVGAVLGRRPVTESGVVGREPERSRAICALRSGSGLGGGGDRSLLLQPACTNDGLDLERLRVGVLVSRHRVAETPPDSPFFFSGEGESPGSSPSAVVRVTTGRSGTGPISLILSSQEGPGEVVLPRAALAPSESTRV